MISSSEESSPSSTAVPASQKRKSNETAIGLPARKKPTRQDDVFAYRGRHFGRAIHAFVNVCQLVANGAVNMAALASDQITEEDLDSNERKEYKIFQELLDLSPELQDGLNKGNMSSTRLIEVGNSIQRGAAASRGDDVKGIKVAVIDWISDPVAGLVPPIPRNQMGVRGFNHEVTGRLLCPAGLDYDKVKNKLRDKAMIVKGDQWPIFLYSKQKYDPSEPWIGFLRGELLIKGFKHMFTSPSSVNDSTRATRAGNARLHGMTVVTPASIVYTATLLRFALGSSATFSRTDTATDSELFYNSLYNFITHPDETEETAALIHYWNKLVFPGSVQIFAAPTENSALARLLAARKARSTQ